MKNVNSITLIMVKTHADADTIKKIEHSVNSNLVNDKSIHYMILTSNLPCLEIQKYYELSGGWE